MNDFDLFRLSKSKAAVDICVTTIRKYFKQGLPFYKRGKGRVCESAGIGGLHPRLPSRFLKRPLKLL